MRMIHVDSSNLNSVGYENGNLYITFNSGEHTAILMCRKLYIVDF